MLRRRTALVLAAFFVAAAPSARARDAVEPLAQRTVDALADGAVLTLPAGRFRVPPGGLLIDRQITIQGANPGRNRLTSGTILLASDTSTVIRIVHEIGNITLRDLIVNADAKAANGIRMIARERPASITLDRVTVWHATADGIRLAAEPGGSINNLLLRDCVSNGHGRDGLSVTGCAFPRIEGGYYAANGRSGVRIERCDSARLRDVYFEVNGRDSTGAESAELVLRGGFNHIVDGCAFEDFGGHGDRHAGVRVAGARGVRIDGCVFINRAGLESGTGIVFEAHSRENRIGLCTWRNVATRWRMRDGSEAERSATQAVE